MPVAGPSTTILYGIVTESGDAGTVKFAHDLDVATWIDIPKTSIASMRDMGTDANGRSRVALTLRTEHAGPVLAAVLAVSLEAVLSVGRKVWAVMDGDGQRDEASTACTNCIKSCKLQVAEDDDPFKQIICMLNCKACP